MMDTFQIVYGGVNYSLRDTAANRQQIEGACRGHTKWLNLQLDDGETLAVVAGPGQSFAVIGLGSLPAS